MPQHPEDIIAGKQRPFTGAEFLESLRDGREVYIYGERVKDVTTHPAFRNAAASVALLYDALEGCTPTWRALLAGARLHLYTDGTYVPAHDREQGLTLEDRIRVLMRTDSVYACVRLSSNWMCSSAYYYLAQVGADLPFALRDLVRIA